MAGQSTYTYDQIEFVLRAWSDKRNWNLARVSEEYRARFGYVKDEQIRYVKNNYIKDPRFGTPYPGFQGRPEAYAKFLDANRPKDFSLEKLQKLRHELFTPNGGPRMKPANPADAGPYSQLPATFKPESTAEPPKPELTTAMKAKPARKPRVRAAKKAATRTAASQAGDASGKGKMPATTATNGSVGGLSGYDSGYTSDAMNNMMGFNMNMVPYAQFPLSELAQPSYDFQNVQNPGTATYGMAPITPEGTAINTYHGTNTTMESSNNVDFDLFDPKFGPGWNESQDLDFGLGNVADDPFAVNADMAFGAQATSFGFGDGTNDFGAQVDIWGDTAAPDGLPNSPTMYKSTLAEGFETPDEGKLNEANTAVDPALFNGEPEEPVEAAQEGESMTDLLMAEGDFGFGI